MTIRETARNVRQRATRAYEQARAKVLPRRRSAAEKLFDEAKPVLRAAAPLAATVAVEEFLRRWRGANRKKALKQEIAPALVGLATAAASNPQVRRVVKDAIDAALPKLEAIADRARKAKAVVDGKEAEASLASAGPDASKN